MVEVGEACKQLTFFLKLRGGYICARNWFIIQLVHTNRKADNVCLCSTVLGETNYLNGSKKKVTYMAHYDSYTNNLVLPEAHFLSDCEV